MPGLDVGAPLAVACSSPGGLMSDTDLLLQSIGVDPAAPGVLVLLPLVEVAWADGEVQAGERALILELAEQRLALDDEGRHILESWLTFRPSDRLLEDGRHALVDLAHAGRLGLRVEDEGVVQTVMKDAKAVARASGGWFGFRAVDPAEEAALEDLAKAFRRAHARARTLSDADAPTVTGENEDEEDEALATGAHAVPPGEDVAWPDAGESTLAPATEPSLPALLHLDHGDERAHALHGSVFRIGRHGSNHLVIGSDGLASRNHAEIEIAGARVVLRDLGSSNGTWVNGERVLWRRLFGGEVIRVGHLQLRYRAPGA